MTIDYLRAYCLNLPGVTEDIKWEHNLCFSVGGKIFLIANPDEFPVSASVKTFPEKFEELITRNGIKPAPYLARNHWIFVTNVEMLSKQEWHVFIDESYRLVFAGLTKKLQAAISNK